MAVSEPVYFRMPAELKDRVSDFAEGKGIQLTDAISALVEDGLRVPEVEAQNEETKRQIALSSAELEDARREVQRLKLHIEGQSRSLVVAERAREEVQRLSALLDQGTVLRCGKCKQIASLRELAFGLCPVCSWTRFELIPDFNQLTPGEVVKTGLAVAGGVAIVAAILGGLGDSGDKA